MKLIVFLLLAIGSLSFTQIVIADCNFPNMNINFPNGSKASEQEVIETQQKVKVAQSGLIAYRECLDKELSSISQELENFPEIERISIDRYNSSVEAEQELAASWSEVVRAYKAK
jgi:hypothetical protein|tara:strand:- start:188 stop:532 length:345 start_codon:yes stop_codon:yes gene_type:complete